MVVHIIPIAFHSKHIYNALKKYGATKIIFIVAPVKDSEALNKVKDAVRQAKKIMNLLGMQYEIVKLKNDYDVQERIKTYKTLITQHKPVVINLTGGPKFDSLILYAIAIQHPENVLDVIYIRDDIEEVTTLPLPLCQNLTKFEKKIVDIVKAQPLVTTKEVAKRTKRSLSQITLYIQNLEKKGIIKTEKRGRTTQLSLAKNFL